MSKKRLSEKGMFRVKKEIFKKLKTPYLKLRKPIDEESVQFHHDTHGIFFLSFDFNIQIDKSLYSPNYGEKYENPLLIISANHSFKQNAIFEILLEIKNIK